MRVEDVLGLAPSLLESVLCIPPADDECSRDVLRVAKSDGCCVCRCVLE